MLIERRLKQLMRFSQWFIGRELNPRIASFDIKTFNEMRPGLILWALLDFCWVLKQVHEFGRPSNSILLAFIFQFWYVFDAEYNEVSFFPLFICLLNDFHYDNHLNDLKSRKLFSPKWI